MSLQTEAMREQAGDQKYVTAYKDAEGYWHGVEMVNHPTPSGCERWMPTYSDKRPWPTPELAKEEFEKELPKLQQAAEEHWQKVLANMKASSAAYAQEHGLGQNSGPAETT